MRIVHQFLAVVALAAYLLVGGQSGLCSWWTGLDIDHHHHVGGLTHAGHGYHEDHDHAEASHCAGAGTATGCEHPAVPCHDNATHEGLELTALTPGAPPVISSPLLGDVPAPAIDFSAPKVTLRLAQKPLVSGCVRGSPPARSTLLCRFQV